MGQRGVFTFWGPFKNGTKMEKMCKNHRFVVVDECRPVMRLFDIPPPQKVLFTEKWMSEVQKQANRHEIEVQEEANRHEIEVQEEANSISWR